MLTASSPSASGKSDKAFCSDPDDDGALLGQAARVISVIQNCRAVNVNALSEIVFKYKTRKTVHFGHMRDDAVLASGWPHSEHYVQTVADLGDLWPKCKDCF